MKTSKITVKYEDRDVVLDVIEPLMKEEQELINKSFKEASFYRKNEVFIENLLSYFESGNNPCPIDDRDYRPSNDYKTLEVLTHEPEEFDDFCYVHYVYAPIEYLDEFKKIVSDLNTEFFHKYKYSTTGINVDLLYFHYEEPGDMKPRYFNDDDVDYVAACFYYYKED